MIKKAIGIFVLLTALITLLLLGYWQVQRAEWKDNIITQLQSEYAKDPLAYPLEFDDLQNSEIQHGHIKGTFDYSKQMLFGPKKYEEEIGYDVLIPMALKSGNVLVNLGWVKGEKREEIIIPAPREYIVLTGISRKPDWNKFTPENSPSNNIWTKLDVNQIAKEKKIEKIAPIIFYAKTASEPFDNFKMMEDRWFPRNKHMQYAFFWFSMAGALLVLITIYFVTQKNKN